jgi:hypothetical protein
MQNGRRTDDGWPGLVWLLQSGSRLRHVPGVLCGFTVRNDWPELAFICPVFVKETKLTRHSRKCRWQAYYGEVGSVSGVSRRTELRHGLTVTTSHAASYNVDVFADA